MPGRFTARSIETISQIGGKRLIFAIQKYGTDQCLNKRKSAMEKTTYAKVTWQSKFRSSFIAIMLCTVICMSAGAIWLSRTASSTTARSNAPLPAPSSDASPARKFDSAKAFDECVAPVLNELQQSNAEAVTRAITNIHTQFDNARHGAPQFAQSIIGPLNGIKTAYLAGKGKLERWWYKDPQIQPVLNHLRWNYEQHVTSGPKIRNNVLASVMRLEQDFRANRNQALQKIHSSIRIANLPTSAQIDRNQLDEYCQAEFLQAIQNINAEHLAGKDAIGPAEGLAISTAATIVVEQAILFVLDDAAVAAGGSVATGAAGGATAGSWAPGAGTALGAAAGLLVGAAVDYWTSHNDQQRTTEQVIASLTQIEQAIIQGDGKHPGVEKILSGAARNQTQQLAIKLRKHLEEAAR